MLQVLPSRLDQIFLPLESDFTRVAENAGKRVPKVLSVTLNVQDRTSADKAVKEVDTAFGQVDILVNNAGYLEEFMAVADSTHLRRCLTFVVRLT